jgi:hypothetical protein
VTSSRPGTGRSNREERVAALLAATAAPRERVLDEHMYTVGRGQHRHPATFRLQLFTAPGARPVAVVVQDHREGALVHERERYAEAVWRQHCPDEAEPPIWIDRLILHGRDDAWFTVVSFPVTGPYQLDEQCGRTRITVPEITRLLGTPLDPSRGAGFRPPPPEPEALPVYSTEWVLRLPRPRPFRNPRCMPPTRPWWRDALRQLAPRHAGRDCCWPHQGDWHQVSRTAIALVRQAKRDGIADQDIYEHVLAQARADGVTGWQLDALEHLVNCYEGILLDTGDDGRRDFINGQHKTRAMLDQGVRRTVIVQWQLSAQP